ncbi:MAG TPA: VWA domain-containing protein [Planctomycetota bacterium]|nr:VWA domain-containing protein [Planctomycetota bacterium]
MRFIYGRWDNEKERQERLLNDLMKLFRTLLAKSAGDVEQALEWLDMIAQKYDLWDDQMNLERFKDLLKQDGQVSERTEGTLELTPKGAKALRIDALNEIFSGLKKGSPGEHRTSKTGPGFERQPETRPYEFGDELWSIAPTDTLNNAVRRSLSQGQEDISIQEQDIAVHETDTNTGCATALCVDCSNSMVLYGEDRMTPARQVALGLVELIKTRYPKDRLHVIAFGDDAFEIPLDQVPFLNWGRWHTNTKAALELSRKLLMRARTPNKQIFLITDGKPTVLDEGGRRYKNSGYWLDPRIVNRTLEEAAQCRRKSIPITTFMVTDDPPLVEFVDELTKTNRGRAYYTALGKLGQFLLVDYIKNRKRSVR